MKITHSCILRGKENHKSNGPTGLTRTTQTHPTSNPPLDGSMDRTGFRFCFRAKSDLQKYASASVGARMPPTNNVIDYETEQIEDEEQRWRRIWQQKDFPDTVINNIFKKIKKTRAAFTYEFPLSTKKQKKNPL